MKPTREQVFSWAREAGFNPVSFMGGNLTINTRFATLAYAAGAAAMKERAAKVCEDATMRTNVALVGVGFAEAIRALGDDYE